MWTNLESFGYFVDAARATYKELVSASGPARGPLVVMDGAVDIATPCEATSRLSFAFSISGIHDFVCFPSRKLQRCHPILSSSNERF